MPELPEPIVDAAQAAALVGVSPATFKTYRADGRVPLPDGRVAGRPWWWQSTITGWAASRPGQGARVDLS